MLSIPGKVYGRVLVERIKSMTDEQIGEEQGGFRKGRGCMDQVFALKMLIEKKLEKQKKLYVGFMDLEKAYDRVNREQLWRVLQEYGVRGNMLRAVKSFYKQSKACVRVGRKEGEMFEVTVGLSLGERVNR